ncbi:HNH endonuclease [Mycobacterium helveticum]|nr:HNH endonuclease signature motif containing protein [Mycobacterium helveticum]
MAWKDAARSPSSHVTATAEWRRLRLTILKRDRYRCQLDEPGCTGEADQVDKIINVADGGDPLDEHNLRAACAQCNARKAQREATKARNAWKRQPEPHPGLRRR